MTTTQHAVRAATHWRQWGRDACMRYCAKNGVSMALLRLCRQLHAVQA